MTGNDWEARCRLTSYRKLFSSTGKSCGFRGSAQHLRAVYAPESQSNSARWVGQLATNKQAAKYRFDQDPDSVDVVRKQGWTHARAILQWVETGLCPAGRSSIDLSGILNTRLKCVYPRLAVVAAKRTDRGDSTSELFSNTSAFRPMNISAVADGTLVRAHYVELFHKRKKPE
jgi:hypothetical protein